MPFRTYPIRNFGQAGLLADPNPTDIPLQGLERVENMVLNSGRMGTARGSRNRIGRATQYNRIFRWTRGDIGTVLAAVGAKVSEADGSRTGTTISTYGTSVENLDTIFSGNSPTDFQAVQLGSRFCLFPNVGRPVYFDNPSNLVEVTLPNWPNNYLPRTVVYFNGHLVIGGDQTNPNLVTWSSVFDENTEFPSTYTADTTNLAGSNPLPSELGVIVGMATLRGELYIYTDKGVAVMTPTGGQEVFSFRTVFRDDGAISRRAIQEVEGYHYVVGSSGIYRHNGTSKEDISDRKIRQTFYASIVDREDLFTTWHPDKNEFTIYFKDTPGRTNNRSYSFDTVNEAWLYRTQEDTFDGISASIGLPDETWQIRNLTDDIESYQQSIISMSANTGINRPELWELNIGLVGSHRANVDPISPVFGRPLVEWGYIAVRDVGRSLRGVIEHTKIDLDEFIGTGTNSIKRLKRILPQFTGEGEVDIEVGASNSPTDTPVYKPAYRYVIGQEYKVDRFVTGRYLALRITNRGEANWTLTGLDIEVDIGASVEGISMGGQ